MIIDEHIHLGGLFQDTDYFLKCLDDANIDIVLATPYMFEDKNIPRTLKLKNIPPWLAGTNIAMNLVSQVMKSKRFSRKYMDKLPNDYIAEMTRKHPERIYGVYWINPNHDSITEVEKQLYDNNFVGVKLHQVLYPCDLRGENEEIFEMAANYKVPVFVHVANSDEIRTMMRYMDKKPDLKIIVAPMGYYEEIADEITDYSNLYLDISPLYANREERIMNAIDNVGVERLIFGSDSPCPGTQKYAVKRVKNLNISEEDKEKIFSQNILSLMENRVAIKEGM